MRKQKGIALPGAIALSSIMLIVSVTVAAVVIAVIGVANARTKTLENDLDFLTAHELFVKGTFDPETYNDGKYKYEVYPYTKGGTEYKALVAKNKVSGEIRYYSVYDFTHRKVMAYQTTNLYITEDEDNMYLGGIVPVDRGI